MRYYVQVTETLTKLVKVSAVDAESAKNIVTMKWLSGDVVLDANDFTEVNYDVVDQEKWCGNCAHCIHDPNWSLNGYYCLRDYDWADGSDLSEADHSTDGINYLCWDSADLVDQSCNEWEEIEDSMDSEFDAVLEDLAKEFNND